MGQFHSDFASSKLTGIFKAIRGNEEKNPNIYSKRFISLGKKCYVDVLEIEESKEVDYHIRMKGIPIDSIKAFCAEKQITPVQLYEQLYEGKEITFDLCKKLDTNGDAQLFTRLKKRNNFEYFNISNMS